MQFLLFLIMSLQVKLKTENERCGSLTPNSKMQNARLFIFAILLQHTNCCNCRSLVKDVLGANILDGLGIDSL